MPAPNPNIAVLYDLENQPKSSPNLKGKGLSITVNLFVIAALTKGISIFKGISDLANKESNRIKEMQKVLRQIGVRSSSSKNDLKIYGKGSIDASKKNINIPNLGDHRICMSAFILSSLTGAKTHIKNFETVFTSAPSFLKKMKLLGAKFEVQN